jgi:hypothetical protein
MQCANKKDGFRGLIGVGVYARRVLTCIFLFQNRETDLFSQNNVKKNQSPRAIQEKSDSADFDPSPDNG